MDVTGQHRGSNTLTGLLHHPPARHQRERHHQPVRGRLRAALGGGHAGPPRDGPVQLRARAGPGVLANDSDPDRDPLTVSLVSGPAHGQLALNPDGTFTYTPDAELQRAGLVHLHGVGRGARQQRRHREPERDRGQRRAGHDERHRDHRRGHRRHDRRARQRHRPGGRPLITAVTSPSRPNGTVGERERPDRLHPGRRTSTGPTRSPTGRATVAERLTGNAPR